jgi:hypothetical protein
VTGDWQALRLRWALAQQIPFGNDRPERQEQRRGLVVLAFAVPTHRTMRLSDGAPCFAGVRTMEKQVLRFVLRTRSEVVTFLNLCDFLTHKSFVFRAHFCEKTKKSQALRMTTSILGQGDSQDSRSEFVTFLNLCDFLTHKSFVVRAHLCEKTKKSQALRMTISM